MTIETGTIIHGTMQPCDLIPAFMDALIDNGADKVAMRLISQYQHAYDWSADFGGLRCDDETLARWLPNRTSRPYIVQAYEHGKWRTVLTTLSGRDTENMLLENPKTTRMVAKEN